MKKRTRYWFSTIFFSGILLILIIGSFLFNLNYNGSIPQTLIQFNHEGKIIGAAPFPPSFQFPLGTDREGYHILHKIIGGAQYTLGAGVVISLLCFLIAFVFGIVGGFSNFKFTLLSKRILTSFYFIPQSIIAYNILYPLLWEPIDGFTTSLSERLIIEMIVLAVICAPTTAILIGNETEQILKEEFITSARVLGGSSFFIFYKHLMPHLKTRLFVIYPKIVIQILLIIAHLGFFTLFFGGTDVCYAPFCDPPKPFVHEWSSLMGTNYHELYNAWWIFIGPMLFFVLTILLLNGIAKSLEKALEGKENNSSIKTASAEHNEKRTTSIDSTSFEFNHRNRFM
ncbi:ABC transporter permease [Rossellomorea aquimaris]|uniref:ABC transporter permease n=1 Tax=Rossellomorea aquimaris TaxID=189382 RepID=UPI0007D08D85|nr:ABC transporter permease subunit [Rossellomorea aquimaris]